MRQCSTGGNASSCFCHRPPFLRRPWIPSSREEILSTRWTRAFSTTQNWFFSWFRLRPTGDRDGNGIVLRTERLEASRSSNPVNVVRHLNGDLWNTRDDSISKRKTFTCWKNNIEKDSAKRVVKAVTFLDQHFPRVVWRSASVIFSPTIWHTK